MYVKYTHSHLQGVPALVTNGARSLLGQRLWSTYAAAMMQEVLSQRRERLSAEPGGTYSQVKLCMSFPALRRNLSSARPEASTCHIGRTTTAVNFAYLVQAMGQMHAVLSVLQVRNGDPEHVFRRILSLILLLLHRWFTADRTNSEIGPPLC